MQDYKVGASTYLVNEGFKHLSADREFAAMNATLFDGKCQWHAILIKVIEGTLTIYRSEFYCVFVSLIETTWTLL